MRQKCRLPPHCLASAPGAGKQNDASAAVLAFCGFSRSALCRAAGAHIRALLRKCPLRPPREQKDALEHEARRDGIGDRAAMKRQRCGDRGAIRADDHARNSPIPPALLRVERFFLGIQRTEQEHADRRHGRRHCGGNGGPQTQKPPDEQKRRKNGQCGQQKAGKLPLGVDPAGIAPDEQKGAEKQNAFP